MVKKNRRTPKHYDGTQIPTKKIQEVLPFILQQVGKSHNVYAEQILAEWPSIIGERFAPMTTAQSFADGILTVSVTNSTLYSLLHKNEKTILLTKLRKKFPGAHIKTILFRIG